MPSIGLSEILVLAVIALLIIKPKDIPFIARKAGRLLRKFRDYQNMIRKEMDTIVNLEIPDEGKDKKEDKTVES